MRVRLANDLADLESDMRAIAVRAPSEFTGYVRDAVRTGNTVARASAKRTAGRHGKHYHRAFTAEVTEVSPAVRYVGEYGPDASKRQGRMSFERGSRNQPPHLDLARSADVLGPAFAAEVGDSAAGMFWPAG